MKNALFTTLLVTILVSTCLAQPWQQQSGIFNPSGVPSLPFSQPRFADLDADGDLDLLIGNIDDKPFFMENDGDNTNPHFVEGAGIMAPVSALDAEMGVFYDLDGDGDLDLITGGYTGLHLFENTGSPQVPAFTESAGFFDGLQTGSNPIPDFGDVDSDGDGDMVIGLSESGRVLLYENTGTELQAEFSEESMNELGDVGLYAYPHFADLDADGDLDLLVGRDGFGFIYYKNNGTPTVPVWETDNTVFAGLGMETYWNSPAIADLNGDDLPDLVFGTASGPLQYFVNSGTPTAPAWQENLALFGGVMDVGGASNPVYFDFDLDGDYDLISGSQMGDIVFYENIGTPSGPAWKEESGYFASIDHSIYSAIAIGDLDADSLPDAIVGDLSGNLYYHHNTGEGFEEAGQIPGIALGGWSAPRLADLDQDDDLDIVAGSENGQLHFIENTGTIYNPQWQLVNNYFGGIDVGSNCVPALVDLDEDGDTDILCGNLWSELTYFENQEEGWVEVSGLFDGIEPHQNTTPAFADLDNDGDPDLTLGEYSGVLSYYRNNKIVIGIDNPTVVTNHLNATLAPNPFTGYCIINFETTKPVAAELRVMNASGIMVHTSGATELPAGRQSFGWNAGDLPAGIYFLHLRANGEEVILKAMKQ
jgi:hypothetical protein